MPPRPGRPPRIPNPRQIARRRALALGLLVLVLGGLGWLAVAAIGGGGQSEQPVASSETLVYRTVTKTTASGPVTTVIAMPKPFHVVFPEGFTRQEMADRVAAVKTIAEHKRHVRAKLSRGTYLSATRKPRAPRCLRHRDAAKTGQPTAIVCEVRKAPWRCPDGKGEASGYRDPAPSPFARTIPT